MNTHVGKLDWIQALRGIAAMMVVVVHSRFVLLRSVAGTAVANTLMFPMAMGVDLFFLISGFLMVLTTSNFDRTTSYAWVFFIKRLARIWPVYAIVCFFALVHDHKGINGFYDPSVVVPFLEGLVFLPHDPVGSPLYFHMFLDVAWTLCFEFYFYVVFALAMLFGRYRYWVMGLWFALTLVIVPMCQSGFTMNILTSVPVNGFRYANLATSPIVWDFIFGMVAAWIYKSRIVIRSPATVYAVVAGVVGWMLIEWNWLGFANFHGPSGWGAPLAVLFLGIVLLSKLGDIAVPRWSVWLGGISYSLYLVHLLVFAEVIKLVKSLHVPPDQVTAVYMVTRPIAAVVVAYLVFRFVETPSSEWLRKSLMAVSFGPRYRRHSPAPSDPAPAGPP